MKINFDAVLVHIDGKPLQVDKSDMTLKFACTESLMAAIREDETATGAVKITRYELAVKVNVGGEVEISPEEASLLKERIGKVFGVAVVGPAYKLLNG